MIPSLVTFLINYKACKRGTLNPLSDPISYSSSSSSFLSSSSRTAYNDVPVAETEALNLLLSPNPIARVQMSSKCTTVPPCSSLNLLLFLVFKVFIYLFSLLLFVFCALCLSPIFLFDSVCCCYHFSSIYIFVFVSFRCIPFLQGIQSAPFLCKHVYV